MDLISAQRKVKCNGCGASGAVAPGNGESACPADQINKISCPYGGSAKPVFAIIREEEPIDRMGWVWHTRIRAEIGELCRQIEGFSDHPIPQCCGASLARVRDVRTFRTFGFY
jgi:hypothetical protein